VEVVVAAERAGVRLAGLPLLEELTTGVRGRKS